MNLALTVFGLLENKPSILGCWKMNLALTVFGLLENEPSIGLLENEPSIDGLWVAGK